MPEKSRSFELLEPASPEALVPDSQVEPWMIAAAAVVVILLLTVLIFRKKKASPIDPLAIRRLALADAVVALDKIGAVSTREAAVQSSLVLRKYLAVVTGDPALFETHEETIARHDALKDFSEEIRTAAAAEFTRLAALKYAAEIPDQAAADVIAAACKLLHGFHQGLRA